MLKNWTEKLENQQLEQEDKKNRKALKKI